MTEPVQRVFALGAPPWPTYDPFLFCVHHRDDYPAGTPSMGVADELRRGRNIGMDFSGINGWSLYHGDPVPGFPRHPHRGFETVTLARRGFVDHSDSLGATARFGCGDVQWMTAGRGIVHSEMFPLLQQERPNPTELFQLWLNLPARSKRVDPHFSMFWSDSVPRHRFAGGAVEVVTIAGSVGGAEMGSAQPPAPPPGSWAADPNNAVAIGTLVLAPEASWVLPAAVPGLNRCLYFFRGEVLLVGGKTVPRGSGVLLRSDCEVPIENHGAQAELLLLQGRPIAEPVAHYGPFVMNTRAELERAISDYHRTAFGGWPWPSDGPVHPREQGRFAVHADGRREEPE